MLTRFTNNISIRLWFLVACVYWPMMSWAGDKIIIGNIENIEIGKSQARFIAKIDTGAENSSLHAQNIKLFKTSGTLWVSFRLKNKYGKFYRFKKKVKRMATIKRKRAPDQLRPVVDLELCLGQVQKTVEVNLVDRGNFKYPFLVGKSFLSGNFIVDVDKSFSVEPNCLKRQQKNKAD